MLLVTETLFIVNSEKVSVCRKKSARRPNDSSRKQLFGLDILKSVCPKFLAFTRSVKQLVSVYSCFNLCNVGIMIGYR